MMRTVGCNDAGIDGDHPSCPAGELDSFPTRSFTDS